MTHHSIQVYSESLIWPLITLLLLSAAAAASLRVRLDMMTEFHRQVRLHQSHTNVQWSGRGLKTAWLGSWARTLSLAVIKVQAVHFWQQSLWQWLWLRLPYFAVDWHIMTLPEPWLRLTLQFTRKSDCLQPEPSSWTAWVSDTQATPCIYFAWIKNAIN